MAGEESVNVWHPWPTCVEHEIRLELPIRSIVNVAHTLTQLSARNRFATHWEAKRILLAITTCTYKCGLYTLRFFLQLRCTSSYGYQTFISSWVFVFGNSSIFERKSEKQDQRQSRESVQWKEREKIVFTSWIGGVPPFFRTILSSRSFHASLTSGLVIPRDSRTTKQLYSFRMVTPCEL